MTHPWVGDENIEQGVVGGLPPCRACVFCPGPGMCDATSTSWLIRTRDVAANSIVAQERVRASLLVLADHKRRAITLPTSFIRDTHIHTHTHTTHTHTHTHTHIRTPYRPLVRGGPDTEGSAYNQPDVGRKPHSWPWHSQTQDKRHATILFRAALCPAAFAPWPGAWTDTHRDIPEGSFFPPGPERDLDILPPAHTHPLPSSPLSPTHTYTHTHHTHTHTTQHRATHERTQRGRGSGRMEDGQLPLHC